MKVAVIGAGPIQLNVSRFEVTVDGQPVTLTATEFRLLSSLMSHPGRVRTRERLLEEVWGSDITVTSRTIDTHVKRLREKLGESEAMIETVRGEGYRFSG